MDLNFDEIIKWVLNESNLFIKSLSLPVVLTAIYKFFKFLYLRYSASKNEKGLFPYYNRRTIADSQKNYIRTKYQNGNPANDISLENSISFSQKQDLLKFFLKKEFRTNEGENRFYLLLADSGMGKSTFMLNLYMRYNSMFYIKPDKKKIRLFPLGQSFEKISDKIKSIEDKSDTILLLDGLDEVPAIDNLNVRSLFEELINLIQDFYFVIITCRTQYFSSDKEEPSELKIRMFNTRGNGFHNVKKIFISPFDQSDINKYIRKNFRFYELRNKRKAHEIIRNTDDLMVRPMILSCIKDLIESENQSLKTTFDIYESLILTWLNRESLKYDEQKRWELKINLTIFYYAVCDFIYMNYDKNGAYIPLNKAIELSQEFKINLSEIEIKSRSLLNRNSNGDYKFSHKSFLEFFLAYVGFIERTVKDQNNCIKYNLENYDMARKFIDDIVRSNKHKFILPTHKEESNLNEDLYRKILHARNESAKAKWISGNCFQIEKSVSSHAISSLPKT
jgi:hypothetical protein